MGKKEELYGILIGVGVALAVCAFAIVSGFDR
jgi:hypothetical protein